MAPNLGLNSNRLPLSRPCCYKKDDFSNSISDLTEPILIMLIPETLGFLVIRLLLPGDDPLTKKSDWTVPGAEPIMGF